MTNIWEMITWGVYTVLSIILNILPDADPTIIGYINGSLGAVKGVIASVAWFFPVNDFFRMITWIIQIEISAWTWKVLKFLWRLTPPGMLLR